MKRKGLTLEQVKASYTTNKREDARKDPWGHYVMRPLSFPVAYWLIRLGISVPVKVVYSGMIIGFMGCVSLLYEGYWTTLLGAILINTNCLLDYVDGDIARATNKVDEYGGRIDGLNYLLITGFLFICIGIGLGSTTWIVVGLATSFLRMLRFAITYQSQLPPVSGKPNIFYSIGMAIIGAREMFLLIAAIIGRMDIFLGFFAVMHLFELLAVLMSIVRK